MITFYTFLNKMLSFYHKFFTSSILHKKTIDSRGIKYAGHLTRFISIMIDLIIYTLFLYFIAVLMNLIFSFTISLESFEKYKLAITVGEIGNQNMNLYIAFILFSQFMQFALLACSSVFMWSKYGLTPAKFLTGIVILDEKTLRTPTFAQSIKRFFAIILSVLPLFLGVIWVIFDKKGQTWHDKLSGTIVVVRSSLKSTFP